jgi:hypothetical protein
MRARNPKPARITRVIQKHIQIMQIATAAYLVEAIMPTYEKYQRNATRCQHL